jgi:hypothetical protein
MTELGAVAAAAPAVALPPPLRIVAALIIGFSFLEIGRVGRARAHVRAPWRMARVQGRVVGHKCSTEQTEE